MRLDALEAELDDVDIATDPDRWALAAYRLAVARGELASRPEQLEDAMRLLAKAARIFTLDRAPLEHARIITAAANGHRALGAQERALALFEQAAELLEGRGTRSEQAAALINVGLARTEGGDASGAVAVLTTAAARLADPVDDEANRLLGAALINRAQAHQAIGTDEALQAAMADYERAVATLEPDSPQSGMAAHGRGALILEQRRRGASAPPVDEAIASFGQALAILDPASYPFQHAVARHSVAIALEQRNGPDDLARALDHLESSLAIFDPRLHEPHWRTASSTLSRIDEALGPANRTDHLVGFLANTSDLERTKVLRDRLGRLAPLPEVRVRTELDAFADALVGLTCDRYRIVARSLLSVLMELPDPVLDAACAALCRAHQASDSPIEFDQALDDVIHDLLFGPQRVRVRDLLEANGWVRP